MGLLKHDDRRSTQSSTQRAVKKASKSSRQAPRTIVPEREVAAEATEPDAPSRDTRGRQPEGTEANPTSVPTSVASHLSSEERGEPGRDGAADARDPAADPEQLEAALRRKEASALALHLHAQPTLTKRTVPAPEPLDPASELARIERELGIPELAVGLARYGTPPVAPAAETADREVLERERLRRASAGVSRWKIGARRTLREEVRQQAEREAHGERERLAAEQMRLQEQLDASWAELASLRDRAVREVEEWLERETRRREAERAEQQAILDKEWLRQVDADPDSVTATLRAAFPEDGVTVIGCLDRLAVLVVVCPALDEVIAHKEPAFTSAGHPTVRARTETRRNDLYLSVVASTVLAAVGRSFSATAGITAVSCIAVRAVEAGAHAWEPIYVGTFDRTYAEQIVAEGRWSQDPAALARALEDADEVDLEVGRAHRIAALELAADPGLAAVMDQLDPAIRSDETAARRSDKRALKAFLNYDEDAEQYTDEDAEHHIDNKNGGDELAHLQRDTDTAVQEFPSGTEAVPQERTHDRSPQGSTPNRAGAISQAAGDSRADPEPRPDSELPPDTKRWPPESDPLPEALKDSDGSVRRAAVEALGRRNDPDDTPMLLEALTDQDEIVRLEAMYALKDRLSPDMRRDALIRASSDSDDIVRRKAIEALADLGDERDTPVLLEALNDPDGSVRLEAIYAVKFRLTPDMRDALIDACTDVNESVRRKAIEALAELGDERDTPLLLRALKDPDSSVRLEAIYALESRSVLASSNRLSEPLLEAMRAEDATVRQAAVKLFGRVEEPTAVRPPRERSASRHRRQDEAPPAP